MEESVDTHAPIFSSHSRGFFHASGDLDYLGLLFPALRFFRVARLEGWMLVVLRDVVRGTVERSEERRVGKECRN